MLGCLDKVVKRIDNFQEECSQTIFALRHLLGEDILLKADDLLLKEEDGVISIYKGSERIIVSGENGIFVESKYAKNIKLIKEAQELLRTNMKEDGNSGPLGGTPAAVDGQQLGGRSVEQLKRKKMDEASVTKGSTCTKCKKGTYGETDVHSDIHGEYTCDKCGHKIYPYKKSDSLKNNFKMNETSVADVAIAVPSKKDPKRMMEGKETGLKDKVVAFLKKNPNPADSKVHALADKFGVDPDKIEEVFYQLATSNVKSMKETTIEENPNIEQAKINKKKIDESEGETEVIGTTPKKPGTPVKLAVQKAKFDSKKITGVGSNQNVIGTIKP